MSTMPNQTLALRIHAPMQSWGIRSEFVVRDTQREPTKSGIVGLLAAARGNPREDDAAIAELSALTMGVRVDREGLVERDFHAAQNVPNTEGKAHRTVVSDRYYLADAVFLVALHGDRDLLAELEQAVRYPHWPLFFGHKAFIPASPLVDPPQHQPTNGTGCFATPLESLLDTHPWLDTRADSETATSDVPLRTVIDTNVTDPRAEPRHDHPLSFHPQNRRFATRAVRTGEISLPAQSAHGACRVPE